MATNKGETKDMGSKPLEEALPSDALDLALVRATAEATQYARRLSGLIDMIDRTSFRVVSKEHFNKLAHTVEHLLHLQDKASERFGWLEKV